MTRKNTYEDFKSKIEHIPFHPCYEWGGSIQKKSGYGIFFLAGKRISAHRASWEIHFGPIPKGMFVCHRCDNRSCVRPDHLFLGDNAANIKDMWDKNRRPKKYFSAEERRIGQRARAKRHYLANRAILIERAKQAWIKKRKGPGRKHS